MPRRRHTSTRLLALVGIFACSKSEQAPIRHDAQVVRPDAAVVTTPTDAESSAGKITISVVQPKAPGSGLAKRCAIGGAPLASDCVGGSNGVAFDKAGTLYVTNAGTLHRYSIDRALSPDCKLAPKGEPLALPANNPRPQTLGKGPIYMRSGGVAWDLVQTPDAVYAHDFLVGLFRVDRDKAEPACTQEFGFRRYVKVGKRLLALRKGVEEVTLGKAGACKAKSAGIDDKTRELFAAGGKAYTTFDDLGVRLCHASAMTACGDGACILDHNCPGLIQLGNDGKVVRQIDANKLFDKTPYSVDGIATAADGAVYIHARHRDRVQGLDVCEAAVYMIPPAVFAL
jgi:hypothetical protein